MNAHNRSVMISRFHVKNFRSIVDLELSFRFGEKQAPNGFREMKTWPFLEDKTGRYVPCLAIYGPNAGGKSNIVLALQILQRLVDGFEINDCYFPNKLHPELRETELELEWSDGNSFYAYAVRYDNEAIVHESLMLDDETLYAIDDACGDFKQLARGEYTAEKLQLILDVECATAEEHRQKTLLLTKLARNYPGLHVAVTKARAWLAYHMHTYPDNEAPVWLAFDILESTAHDEKGKETMRERVFELIQRLDLGIQKIDYKREVHPATKKVFWERGLEPCSVVNLGDKTRSDSIFTWHTDTQGRLVRFRFEEESRGTQLLIGLCCLVVAALETGRAVIIDEIDQSLHPLLLETIVRLFKSKEHNPRKAQLIFTTHTMDLLDRKLLRVSEVAVVDKNLARGTTVTRMSQIEGIRNVTDYRRRYLDGEFGGIPFPYL